MSKSSIPVLNLPKLNEIVSDIESVLEGSGLTIEYLTLKEYSKNGGKFDGRMLRRFGGFDAIVNEAFHSDKKKEITTARYMQRRDRKSVV